MQNGVLGSPGSSNAALSSSAALSPTHLPNGHAHNGVHFRERILFREKQELLEERQRILDRTDEQLLCEIKQINDRKEERKQMLRSRMKRQQEWYRRRKEDELERIQREKLDELKALPELMYNQLEKLKETLLERVKQMNVLDRRTLNVISLADKPLSTEPALLDDEDGITESPTAVTFEKRDILPGRLTADAAIREDLLRLNQSTAPTDATYAETARIVRPRHKVILDKSRLIYDGKTFYRGQKLFVQTTNYTRFPAIVALLTDDYIHIKARMPGDTRDVYATIDDLRSGRVRIGRKVEQTSDSTTTATASPQMPLSP